MGAKLTDLRSDMLQYAEDFISYTEEHGFPVIIYSTRRSFEEQARLFRQGRTIDQIQSRADELETKWGRPDLAQILMDAEPQRGPIRTNAAPGQSLHNYGVAFDGAPLRNGEIVWNTDPDDGRHWWNCYGICVRAVGLEWGGDWASLIDMPHAQIPGVHWEDLIRL